MPTQAVIKRYKPRPLNFQQQQFVLHYCSNGFNALQAALAANYQPSYALASSTKLAKKNGIKQAIEAFKSKLGADLEKKCIEKLYSRTEAFNDYDVVQTLALTLTGRKLALDAANTAIKGKARLFGLDLDHQEIDIYPGRRPDNTQAVQDSKARLQAHRQQIKSVESVQIQSEQQPEGKE